MAMDPSKLLFAKLAALRQDLQARPLDRSLGEIGLADLLSMAQTLERAHEYAAEMELGASGFDNTESMRYYSDLQRHLLAAAEEIAQLCSAIIQRTRFEQGH